ncbi:M48 metallopeptidase family protein [Methylovulum psychrotolerans]|uniref:Metal-dependent hydrolase n=1 Tax=Methylovulum psychrotolerans TaxID=1704499 RepID=A0A1Z4BVD7_9GAMM|nr:YgjP-like metallopeptidase domain-containing protein [Methylovulum psychrotolerans]ASF45256.1 metal-dependent hydrolase [Methylovulum psychrotolerans]
MAGLKYLAGYSPQVNEQVQRLIDSGELAGRLRKKYPASHTIRTDKALYTYTVELKNQFLRQSNPLSKVVYDDKLDVLHQALGLHTFISRVQGGNLKAKHEIRVGAVFKTAPLEFLRMIVVHELAHLREKEHNKAFYKLCEYMEPDYHQLEFDMRLYLTCLELGAEGVK